MVLDIGDTPDIVHGHQKLAEWNARYDGRCFQPIHIHDTATGLLVAVLLRPGKTPGSAMPWRGPGGQRQPGGGSVQAEAEPGYSL